MAGQTVMPGIPVTMAVNISNTQSTSILPLCMMLNARSVYNKVEHLKDLYQLGPDLIIVSETFERKNKLLETIIGTEHYHVISYHRGGDRTGGGCAIIYTDKKYKVEKIDVDKAEGVEAVWAMFTPRENNNKSRIKRIAVGSFYVSPNSKFKTATIDHIIETIHIIRSRYDNEVNFLFGGDFNRLNINSILDSYCALKQCVTVPTRKEAILEIVLSDMSHLYHPPTTLPPLQADSDKNGADSDHNIVIFAPNSNSNHQVRRTKKTIKVRPLPDSKIYKFEHDMINCDWGPVVNTENVDEKVSQFHQILTSTLDKHFPEKTVKISSLHKK